MIGRMSVVGTGRRRADGAALVEVDYEPQAPVVDPEAAMTEGSPIVLDSKAEAEGDEEGEAAIHGAASAAETEPEKRPPNVTGVASFKRGDVASALAGADAVIKARYQLAAVHHSPMEPHVSMARPEPDGSLTIWAPTQGPFYVRDEVAKVLDVAPHNVRVVPMPVGGGFGGKVSLLENLLALLALRLQRPVRLALDRQQ